MTRADLSEEGKKRYDEVIRKVEEELASMEYAPVSGQLDRKEDPFKVSSQKYLPELEKIFREDTAPSGR